jgi:hypothetical protein
MKNNIISREKVINLLSQLLSQVQEFIFLENKKNEVDELTENIAILYNKELIALAEEDNDYDEDDLDISFSNELESQFKSKVQAWMGTPAVKTTLDTILDKINVLGMDSLTKHELTLLQNYSNN